MRIAQRAFNNPLSWLAIAFTLSLLVPCSSKLENAIVGKWSEVDGTEMLEFFKDGTLTAVDKGRNMGGTYKFVDKDRMKLEMGGLGALMGPFVATISISGNELTWTMPDGKVTKYKRAK